MGRKFLTRALLAFLLLPFALRLESRLPDSAGPGEESVALFGMGIYRKQITRADVGRHSSIPALLVSGAVLTVGALIGGGLAVVIHRVLKKSSEAAQPRGDVPTKSSPD